MVTDQKTFSSFSFTSWHGLLFVCVLSTADNPVILQLRRCLPWRDWCAVVERPQKRSITINGQGRVRVRRLLVSLSYVFTGGNPIRLHDSQDIITCSNSNKHVVEQGLRSSEKACRGCLMQHER